MIEISAYEIQPNSNPYEYLHNYYGLQSPFLKLEQSDVNSIKEEIEKLKENAFNNVRSQDIDGYKQALEDVIQLISTPSIQQ
ncbi:MAG: hypothetical protein ABRQ38_26285 [Candidatus Eremiobacterota bacterium]